MEPAEGWGIAVGDFAPPSVDRFCRKHLNMLAPPSLRLMPRVTQPPTATSCGGESSCPRLNQDCRHSDQPGKSTNRQANGVATSKPIFFTQSPFPSGRRTASRVRAPDSGRQIITAKSLGRRDCRTASAAVATAPTLEYLERTKPATCNPPKIEPTARKIRQPRTPDDFTPVV